MAWLDRHADWLGRPPPPVFMAASCCLPHWRRQAARHRLLGGMAPLLRLLVATALATSASASEQLISLDGTWQLRDSSPGQQQQQPVDAAVPGTTNRGSTRHDKSVDAAVPGTAQGSLFAAGLAPDPQFGYNQVDAFHAAAASTFTFSRTFPTPGGCSGAAGQRCELVFDGIDTAANVTLNGATLGQANDMHLRWVFDATKHLKPGGGGDNTLEVIIQPAVQYARAVAVANGDPNCTRHTRNYWPEKWGYGTECSGYIRKNTGSFGWDCAPAYTTSGIWKSVSLRVIESATIDMVVPQISGTVDLEAPESTNRFEVEVRVFIAAAAAGEATVSVAGDWSATAVISRQVQLQPSLSSSPQLITLKLSAVNVPLWWPNGMGPSTQTLHNLTTTLTLASATDGAVPHIVQQAVGFRTFEFVGSVGNSTAQHGDRNASLWFRVNGAPLFAKGNNWMPSSVLTADDASYKAKTVARLEDEIAIGGNTIRVWGGGIYETETFYETADRLGLIILQDGSFFGSYPTINVKQSVESPENRAYGEFQELVRVEIEYQARRLAPHPSMCLYSGNNESPDFANLPLFVATQLGTMQKENTNAVLLPSCPSDGWATLKPLTPRNGYQWTPGECETADGGVATCPHDNHYYGPCGTIPANTKTGGDRGLAANFGSEFGWPSADVMSVSDKITPAGAGWLLYEEGQQQGSSPFLMYRSQIKNPDWTVESMLFENSTMSREFPTLLGVADNGTAAGLERWLYLTQALQARCVGGSVSAYRQHTEVMGALNWAVNSIWVGPAWGSVSHDGSWKALMYRLRHVFAPVLLSFIQPVSAADAGEAAINTECADGHTCLHLSNNLHKDVTEQCSLHVREFSTGKSAYVQAFTATAPAVGGVLAGSFPTAGLLQKAGCAAHECWFTAACVGGASGSFEAQPHFPTSLSEAKLLPVAVTVSNAKTSATESTGSAAVRFSVSVNTTALYVFFSSETPGKFSDNTLTLLPGKPTSLSFEPTVTDAEGGGDAVDLVAQFLASTRVYTMNNKHPTHLARGATGM